MTIIRFITQKIDLSVARTAQMILKFLREIEMVYEN